MKSSNHYYTLKEEFLKPIIVLLLFYGSIYMVSAENRHSMTYREEQREKAIALLGEMFNDPGGGKFANGYKYPFVLQDPSLNLWEGIRHDALAYFKNNNIPWWMSTPEMPTGHLLSSQIACVNHLYYLRNQREFATNVLRNIDSRIISAEELVYPDTNAGYVAFEIVGKENYLGERQHTRGANATSVDAVMVGKKTDGKNILVLIEWKYTEYYENGKSLYIPARFRIYNPLLGDTDSPFKTIAREEKPFEPLYYEPFYELMRQTLLGWKMASINEYDCDEYIHLYIVPEANAELLLRNTSPGLNGNTLIDAWQGALKAPSRFKIITPEKLLEPLRNEPNTQAFFDYLEKRYWY
jgi:hypothetical protein